MEKKILMTNNKLIKWETIEDIPQNFDLCEFTEKSNILTLNFKSKEKLFDFKIVFNGYFAYRNTKCNSILEDDLNFSRQCGLLIMEDSPYLKWFHYSSCNIHENDKIKHHIIKATNNVVEILDFETPTIELKED